MYISLENAKKKYILRHSLDINYRSSREVRDFAELYKIKLLNSSSYYAQANGQDKYSNKTLIELIKKKIENNPKRWHEIMSEKLCGLIANLGMVLLKLFLMS